MNDVLWLKNNSEPWSSVIDKWNSTFDYRKKLTTSTLTTVTEFFKQWPIFNDLRSDVLVR